MKTLTTQIVSWLKTVCPSGELFSDSREVSSSSGEAVFFAYPGDSIDGRNFIAHALQNGAKAVLYEESNFVWDESWPVPHLAVSNLKAIAGPIADAYYGHPSSSLFTVAITGTNGKTSCAHWLGSALSQLNMRTAVIGTLGVSLFDGGKGNKPEETGYTTPDQVQLQRILAKVRENGAVCAAVEATSIGIDQQRLNGMHIDVALFTNFTRDHLDYHKDMSAYKAAKRKLFDWPGLQHAVLNLDDPVGAELAAELQGKLAIIAYTQEGKRAGDIPTLSVTDIRSRPSGLEFSVESPFGSAKIKTHLIGRFNVSNVLGVLGVLLAKGIDWTKAVESVSKLEPPLGRMQQMGGRDTPLVVIDFAHTPDALEKGLLALRQVATERAGKLWCVFGCGGDRDVGKRPQMGAVAEMADHVVVTSDNPRSEVPQQIIEQIVSGMKNIPQTIEDRATAILQAVRQAGKNDVIFLAGRGHETFQEVMGVKLPFVDADHAALALASRATMKKSVE